MIKKTCFKRIAEDEDGCLLYVYEVSVKFLFIPIYYSEFISNCYSDIKDEIKEENNKIGYKKN